MEVVVVLYPSPGMGHLVSMVELGKLILKHHPSISIIILTIIPSFNTGATAAYVRHVSATLPSIIFHHLPTISLPLDPSVYPSMEAIIFDHLRLSNPHVHDALQSILLSTTTISAFVIDLFCTPALPIASTFNIPTYYFFTSAAACLAMFFYLPTIHNNTTISFKDMDTPVEIPSLPPIPTSDMPKPLLDRNFTEYAAFLDFANHLTTSAGIIVNTFDSLEPKSLKAFSDGTCVPDGPTPPIYCTGPIIIGEDHGGGGVHECLKWLDTQPSQSVVFLCFGSLGLLSADQLKEIGIGLEKSGVRFLWVVRSPPSEKNKNTIFLGPPPPPDLELLLPNGFLDRTKDRGLVVKSWAPQVPVLNHNAVGGFVTHCGWNSVLEAISAGVPMIAWPLYAEQKFNRVVLVEEMKLALPIDQAGEEGGLVVADEVEKRVRELMELEEGGVVRATAKAKREEARAAMEDGGSSRRALAKLVHSWKLN